MSQPQGPSTSYYNINIKITIIIDRNGKDELSNDSESIAEFRSFYSIKVFYTKCGPNI